MSDSIVAPRLSIIVATWNAVRTFERCIASIEDQTFTDWELLIPDGGSTDGTADLIGKHERSIAWWQSGRDGGIYDAWNQALGRARGEYVCFLSAGSTTRGPTRMHSRSCSAATGGRGYDLVSSRARVEVPRREERRGSSARPGISGGWDEAWSFVTRGTAAPPRAFSKHTACSTGVFASRATWTSCCDCLEDLATLHVDAVTVRVEAAGISRKNVLARLREQRIAFSRCSRYGPIRARLVWMDKLWRYPIAHFFGIPH